MPEVKMRLPARFAGMYEAFGFGTADIVIPRSPALFSITPTNSSPSKRSTRLSPSRYRELLLYSSLPDSVPDVCEINRRAHVIWYHFDRIPHRQLTVISVELQHAMFFPQSCDSRRGQFFY